MKMIVAVIRPEKLEDVQAALAKSDVYLMTVSDVRGCGVQGGYTEVYRGTEFQVRLLPKLKLEIAINDAFLEGGFVDVGSRSGNVLPRAWEVGKAEINRLDLFFTDQRQDFFRRHSSHS